MGRSKVATSPCAGFSDAIRSTLVDSTRCRRPHSFISARPNNLSWRRLPILEERGACCVNLFYRSSSSLAPSLKHFTAEGAEELRDRKIE